VELDAFGARGEAEGLTPLRVEEKEGKREVGTGLRAAAKPALGMDRPITGGGVKGNRCPCCFLTH